MTSDVRRELILSAAKRCFAHNGFAGTTTKSVAAAASISEALLFKHFPTKAALYAEILAEACQADPALHRLLDREPSTETLVILIRGMVKHFLNASASPDQQEAQRLRLMVSSQLDDGEFARLLYEKIRDLIGRAFTASLERAIAAGDAGAGRARAAQSVLVCASYGSHDGSNQASLRSNPVIRRRTRPGAADL